MNSNNSEKCFYNKMCVGNDLYVYYDDNDNIIDVSVMDGKYERPVDESSNIYIGACLMFRMIRAAS